MSAEATRGAVFDALAALDAVLSRAVNSARPALGEIGEDPYRGMFVDRDEALRHARSSAGERPGWLAGDAPGDGDRPGALLRGLPLLEELEPFDLDALVLSLAPEVDLGYERIYAYLHDDLARRRPTVALALDLFAGDRDERVTATGRFAADAPLVACRIVELRPCRDDPDGPVLGHALAADPQIVGHLLGRTGLDARLAPFCRIAEADPLAPGGTPQARALAPLARAALAGRAAAVLRLSGGERRACLRAARQVAWAASAPVLEADLATAGDAIHELAPILAREARLRGAALLLTGLERSAAPLDAIASGCGLTLLAAPDRVPDGATSVPVIEVELGAEDAGERHAAWARAVGRIGAAVGGAALEDLATRFRLTSEQVNDAVDAAGVLATIGGRPGGATVEDLFAAARAQGRGALGDLAHRVDPVVGWDDIVLDADHRAQLEELCDHVRHRDRVFHEMGFADRLPLGTGLTALFSGPPGTGKTMAAAVVARALGLDLYRIDLSQVVSKYIGETEKSLERIFAAAEASDAILFFDEADALFGKRSEVKDAHDRFANIEVAYLLQRMEAYEGVTILATNLRHNLDRAFLRRLRFVVEFPHPDERLRLEIWRRVWPPAAALAPDVDLEFLARRFELSGGHIRNIALGAAFLAAGDDGRVAMRHLVMATRREHQKGGQLLAAEGFAEYGPLLLEAAA